MLKMSELVQLSGHTGPTPMLGPSFQDAEPVIRLLLVTSASKRPKYFRFGELDGNWYE